MKAEAAGRRRTKNALAARAVEFVQPMLALPVRRLPDGPEWLYEIKFDAYPPRSADPERP